MTDDTTNLVLDPLRAIRADVSSIRQEQRTMKAEISALRQQVRALTVVDRRVEDIVTIPLRLDRIERRLELTEPAE